MTSSSGWRAISRRMRGEDAVFVVGVPRSGTSVLRHRMAINFGARADGVTIDNVIERLTAPFR